jgi:hypothetical protein
MSLTGATVFVALATSVLAIGAIVTAIFAILAFRKQTEEVGAIIQQVEDQRDLAQQQAELLKIQSGQLELQRQQFADQREANTRQAEVFDLQASELRESLKERKREAADRRRAQASGVLLSQKRHPYVSNSVVMGAGSAWVSATIVNNSSAPAYDVELQWHEGSAPDGEPNPEPVGVIMPGAEQSKRRVFSRNADLDVCGALVTFRDAAGITWMRSPDGALTEQS